MRKAGDASLDARVELENLNLMPTLSLRASKKVSRKAGAVSKRKTSLRGPSFGEWARRVAGIVRSGRSDLSTREGFGD